MATERMVNMEQVLKKMLKQRNCRNIKKRNIILKLEEMQREN
jgi:hypothetical protein